MCYTADPNYARGMMMESVLITEVGPRDGLQNEKMQIPTAQKIAFINTLSESGLRSIEATSFVSPRWVPQLADHVEVYQEIIKKPGVRYPVLIPNAKGMEAAIDCGVRDIAVFTAVSEAFTMKNTNCTIAESLSRIRDVIMLAKAHDIKIRGYISCVVACPYAGKQSPEAVAELTQQLLELGCYEISLGDTIGVATPKETESLLKAVLELASIEQIAMHFHDTYQHALDNIKVSLEMGIRSFDASVGGLGGCPYADGATGNVATEKVVDLLESLGYSTGVDHDKLIAALGKLSPSQSSRA